jgi:hypothetical protein
MLVWLWRCPLDRMHGLMGELPSDFSLLTFYFTLNYFSENLSVTRFSKMIFILDCLFESLLPIQTSCLIELLHPLEAAITMYLFRLSEGESCGDRECTVRISCPSQTPAVTRECHGVAAKQWSDVAKGQARGSSTIRATCRFSQ